MRLKSHSALCPQLEAWANALEEVLTDSPIPRKGVRKKQVGAPTVPSSVI